MRTTFGIIGCGRIAKRHAEQIIKHGFLVAVCDIDAARSDEFAHHFNARSYDNITDFLNTEKCDVISICTPNGLHASHSIACLKAGAHVLCEKPLSINSTDCKAMINAAQENHKRLFVVKQNRYNPPVAFVKDLLRKNALGKIYSFQLNCFWNRPDSYYTGWKGTLNMDGGTLFTQFSHFIDLIYWYFGDISNVNAIKKNYHHPNIEFEDSGAVLFEMQSGITGAMNYSVNAYQKNREGSMTIIGEKGIVRIGGQYLNELEYCDVEGVATPLLEKGNPSNMYGHYEGSMSNHDKVYENLLLALESPQHELASAEEGLKTIEIIEKIYAR